MMNIRSIITCVMLAVAGVSYGQKFAPSDYIYPLEGVSRLYSASFGELRSDHFHSGIDIKTEGVEGKRVVAVADGYISRIGFSAYGYGLALYVTHPNGSTSVYAHLSRFRDDVAEYVESERYRTKQNSVNLFCRVAQFRVKQGDLIGYSGNSGSSGGPHLHFEIRDSATQEPINTVSEGIITPRDTIAPLLFALHYIETDTLQGIVRQASRRSFDLRRSGEEYSIAGGGSVGVGRSGYFVLEASDRRCGVTNTFALYRVKAQLNGKLYFDYAMDRISFARTRYCNAVGYYPLMIGSRREVIRLGATENSDRSHYRTIQNSGSVSLRANEKQTLTIEVFDDCGNVSTCNVNLIGKSDERCFVAEAVEPELIIKAREQFTYKRDSVAVTLPSGALYESIPLECAPIAVADTAALSTAYKILSYSTPLHKPMSISIVADVPLAQQSKVGLICVGRTGYRSFIKGEYRYGRVTASARAAGVFYVATDTVKPTIKLGIADGSNQKSSSYFTCTISDDLSGVASYSAWLDGKWIALDRVGGRLRHRFREKPTATQHTLRVEATDGVGNKTTVSCTFMR